MSSRAVWLGLSSYLKCSFRGSSSLLLILALLTASCMAFSSHFQALGVSCKSRNISAEFGLCGIHPGGVHDLNCFGKYGKINCTWKPGSHTREKKYTIILKQRKKYCQIYNNITRFYSEIIIYHNNLTVMVFENPESTNCTKAVFSASPQSLRRCGPPEAVFIRRQSGGIDVNVNWDKEDAKLVNNLTVRYKEPGSPSWTESNVESHNGNTCRVKNLNSSLAYVVQTRCVANEKCCQCPWSEAHTVAPELTTQPVIVKFEDTDIADRKGCRQISVTWKFSAEELHDGYRVSIGKVSGEREEMNISQPEIRLILASSAYQLNISAYNNASTSRAVRHSIPQRKDLPGSCSLLSLVSFFVSF